MGKLLSQEQLDRFRNELTPEEFAILEEADNPIIWAERHFKDPDDGKAPFKVKKQFYPILLSRAKDRALRTGRQVGKCPSASSHIQLADGSWITADELYAKVGEDGTFRIASTDIRTLKHISTDAIITDNGIKPVTRVVTRSLFSCTQSSNHPYLVWRDDWDYPCWLPGTLVRKGDRIAVTRDLRAFRVPDDQSVISKEEAELLGYLTGDGGTTQRVIRFTSNSPELVNRINDILTICKSGIYLNEWQGKYEYGFIHDRYSPDYRGFGVVSWITELVTRHGLAGCLSKDKVVPPDMFRSSNEAIASYLGGYWSTDGWVCTLSSNNQPEIGVGSASKELLDGIRTLLLRLGIQSRLAYKPVKYKNQINNSWQLYIRDSRSIDLFRQQIRLYHHAKQTTLDELILKTNNSNTDTIPLGVWNYVERLRLSLDISKTGRMNVDWRDNDRLRYNYCPNRSKLDSSLGHLDDPFLKAVCSSDIFWDTVKTIKHLPAEQTYAISVPVTENLITDNFITHNTVHACIDMLHESAFHRDYVINVFVPQKKNMNRMLEIMANLVRESDIRNSFMMGGKKKGNKEDIEPQYDYEITCTSGSVIRFFFMGNNPDKARGQHGKGIIYIDEVEYLPEKAFPVLQGILKSNPNIRIFACSTPSGLEDTWFRNFCDRCLSPTYENGEEYHLPTTMEENWQEIEGRLRQVIFDEVTWKLEVLAEWTDAIGAVYKKDVIDAAVHRALVNGIEVDMESIRSTLEYQSAAKFLGVDWNVPQNGVRLVEVARVFGFLRVTRHETISHETYTQTYTVQRIMDLYHQYKYTRISVDAGYGDTQIELLHKSLVEYGVDPRNILFAVDSTKKIENTIVYESPLTGARRREIISLRTKVHIIGLIAKYLEKDLVLPPEEDQGRGGLVKEIRNFRRKEVNQDRGGFVYTSNTHSLSALQICIFGHDQYLRTVSVSLPPAYVNMTTSNLSSIVSRRKQATSPIAIGKLYKNQGGRVGGLDGRKTRSLL
jgi:hypothetical protein